MKGIVNFVLLILLLIPVSASADGVSVRVAKIKAADGFMVWESENVRGTDVDAGIVDSLMPFPAEDVIALLRNYDGYRTFLAFFNTTRVMERDEEKALLRLKATIGGGSVKLKATAYMREKKQGDTTHFELRYRKGNVKRMDGDWFVTPIDDKSCLVKMRLLVDPDLWLVSDSQLSEYNLVNSRRTIRSIKKKLGR